MSERQSYTMTSDEFTLMGGKPAPEGYDPDANELWTREGGLVLGKSVRGSRLPEGKMGTILGHTINHTDPDWSWEPAEWTTIQQFAESHGIKPLTINWPDKYSPDFTAVPV